MTLIIAIVGTPHSGKTVFINTLHKILLGKTKFFIHTACPDGEGRWCTETDPELIKKIRAKGKFDQNFVNYNVNALKALKSKNNFNLVLVDLGGLPTQENRAILEHCDYYIFLRRPDKQELIQKWQQLLDSLKLKPIAIFESLWDGEPEFSERYGIFYGRLVRLDRMGVPDPTVEVIRKFGEFLVKKFGGGSVEEKFVVKISEHPEWVLVDVTIGGNGILAPDELGELVEKVSNVVVGNSYFGKGVIISGRLPVWAHSALAHAFHGAKWVAHFDPRLGAVITASHDTSKSIGTVIPHEQLSI